ncbi:MAG: DUF859 family phage minor structural protein [Anaerococcus hydrogenalis]|uniref:DUF859 family phage minor structural protein n=1 Tax=Anaerococcus hydrogenalis TaxID=33029 RepID=UPI00290A4DFD|nr:DUF859 family phage minor structural protein [Anaerococcus hydrogenalis]MDU3687541.1 DUF859 family phage minor structural protein [Anaerococcus hydrogenalis]
MATYNKIINNGWGVLNLELRQESQNIGNNTSTVYYKLYLSSRNNAYFYNNYHTGKTSIVINGSTVHNQTGRDFNISRGGSQQLASGTTTVKHNEDGSKSFSFSASIWASNFSGNISGNFSLSKIPRASSFSLQNTSGTNISSIYSGNTVKIAINKKVSSFTHTIKVSYSGNSETLANKTTSSSVNWSNSNKVMTSYMQNLKSMNLTFSLETYDGSTRIGTSSKNLTLKVPSSAGPSISNVVISEANQNKINIIGSSPFYQHLTDLRVKTSASGKYGAGIKNVSVSIGSYVLSGSDVILKGINLKDSQSVKVTVRDTRDMSASTTRTINLNPYNLPNISFFNAYRNQSNTKYASARIALTATVIDNKNPLDVKVDVAEKDSNSWKNVYSATVGNGKFNDTISLGGGFDDYKAYDVRLSISDKFKRHQALSTISATSQSLVIGANKPVVGIGKVPTIDKGLEVDGIVKINSDQKNALYIDSLSTAGTLIMLMNNGKQVGWIGNFGEGLTLGDDSKTDIRISNSLRLNGDIKPYNNVNPYEVNKNDMNGYIKCTKDPLGIVHLWGSVKITGTYPTKRWNVWGKIPQSWGPKVISPIPSSNGSRVLEGLAITKDGVIIWIGDLSSSYNPSVGDSFQFDYCFRAGDSSW